MYVGAEVVTRRGKRGTVVAVGDGTVDVRFGSNVYTMRNGQVVLAREYDRWGKHTKGMTNR